MSWMWLDRTARFARKIAPQPSSMSESHTVLTGSTATRRDAMQKWLCAAILAGVCAACGSSSQQSPASAAPGEDAKTAPAPPEKPAEPVFKEVTIPAGTTLRLELKTAVASDTSKVEDPVRAV